jgi:hypothetical protein
VSDGHKEMRRRSTASNESAAGDIDSLEIIEQLNWEDELLPVRASASAIRVL